MDHSILDGGLGFTFTYNYNENLGEGDNSQQWTKPQQVLDIPGHTLWYPSLQPMNTPEDIQNKYTCVRLGKKARLFFKDMFTNEKGFQSEYMSAYVIEFDK